MQNDGLGIPKIIFQTPSEIFQNPDNYHINIFEKIFTKRHEFEVLVRTHIISKNPETDNQTEQNAEDFTLKIPYYTFEKSLNTGIILNIGLIVIFALLLSSLFDHRREKIFSKTISHQEIKMLEEEAKQVIENKENTKKKFALKKKNPKK